jgi:hypothetical protein
VSGLLDLIPILESDHLLEREGLESIVSLIAGSLICFSTGYQSIDQISLKYDQQTVAALASTPPPEMEQRVSLKRKSESRSEPSSHSSVPASQAQIRRAEILNPTHELLAVPLLHVLTEVLSLAHSNPNQIKREQKQVQIDPPTPRSFS